MRKLVIIHFAPLELYPPIQNLLEAINKRNSLPVILVVTTQATIEGIDLFCIHSERIKILRLGKSGQKLYSVFRYINYIYFYTVSLLLLIWHWPKRILYFETISSFPAFVFKRFFCPRCDVLIHYHEYTSPDEFRKGSKLINYFHQKEKCLYPHSIWVSHTNQHRLNLFKLDITPIQMAHAFVLPNYPPKAWFRKPTEVRLPLKIVYAGALSMHTMYTQAFAEWVLAQQGDVLWDIYSYNYTEEARSYINSLNTSWIKLKSAVNYANLADQLQKYDVGVILYNGHIPNYIYNAPNKLFEYWACGLAVWFPDIMTGSKPYCTENIYPEVLAIDFTSLNTLNPQQLVSRNGSQMKPSPYYCEEALQDLIHHLLE